MKVAPNVHRTPDLMLTHCLYIRRQITRYDMDWWRVHVGDERTGKTTEAMWECWRTDPSFARHWQDRIAYDGEQFLAICDRLHRGQSVMLDEAGEAWNRLDWHEDVYQALDKAAMMIGYKGLDVHLNVPQRANIQQLPVGKAALQRAANVNGNLVYIYAIRLNNGSIERGHSELYTASKSLFGKKKYGGIWWDLRYHYQFLPFPRKLYEAYAVFKVREGDRRLARYIDDAATERGQKRGFRHVDRVIEELRAMPEGELRRLRNRRGSVDFSFVWHDYRSAGLTFDDARYIARILTRERPAPAS